MISVLVALAILISWSRSSIPRFEYSVWSLNSGGSWLVAQATQSTASLIPTSSCNFDSNWLFFTLFQMLSSISISPSFNASKIVSSVLVPLVSGFLCGFIGFTTVTLFAGEGSGFSFTRSLFWGLSYHPDCRCGREHGLLIIEAEVHCGLWLWSQISHLLSFVKVYLSFLLHSKLDELVIGRPLVYSLAIDQMGHSSSQLRIHALKEAVDQKSSLLVRVPPKVSWDWSRTLPAAISSLTHTVLWAHCVSESWHRNPATICRYAVAGQSASSSLKQSGHCLPTCNFDETILPKIHWRGSYWSHSLGHSSNTLNRHIDMHLPTISRDCWYWNHHSILRGWFFYSSSDQSFHPAHCLKLFLVGTGLGCRHRGIMNSTQTGQCFVSVRHSALAFEEVVNWRQSCSGPGPPTSEHNHHHHCEGWTFDSFPSFPETHLGNSLTLLMSW